MKKCLLSLVIAFMIAGNAAAQTEAAILSLLIQPSAQANAMGRASVALAATSPAMSAFNPAHFGVLQNQPLFSVEIYPAKTQWLPAFGNGITFDAKSFAVSLPLGGQENPQKFRVGFSYNRTHLDLGEQTFTGEDSPEPLGTVSSFERANVFSVAIGVESFVNLAAGYSFKSIESTLGAISQSSEVRTINVKPSAHDFGVVATLPVLQRFASDFSFSHGVLKPFLHTTAGYSQSNIGGTVQYLSSVQADPLPRVARLGVGVRAGLLKNDWQVFAFDWSREAEDVLVRRKDSGEIESAPFVGDIDIVDELFLGKEDRDSIQKTGWAYHIFEVVSIQRGRYYDLQGRVEHGTEGIGVSLRGFFKLLGNLSPGLELSEPFDFLLRKLDIHYQTTSWQFDRGHPLSGTTFKSIRVSLF